MCGECDKCGEHCLECRCNEPDKKPKGIMEWISVKDRLPEAFIEVLTWCVSLENTGFELGESYCAVDRFCIWTDKYPDSFRTDRFYNAKVIYWMPLPEPPKLNKENSHVISN